MCSETVPGLRQRRYGQARECVPLVCQLLWSPLQTVDLAVLIRAPGCCRNRGDEIAAADGLFSRKQQVKHSLLNSDVDRYAHLLPVSGLIRSLIEIHRSTDDIYLPNPHT